MSPPVPHPPYTADEATMLRAFVDSHRATIRRQTAGLDAAQLAATLPGHPATMTLGGVLKHLAFVEHWWFSMVLHGRPPQGIWADVDWDADRDWDWHSAREDSPEELRAAYDAEVSRSDASLDEALAHGDLDQLAKRARGDGRVATLRWILLHLVEEYARHAGHADLVRESVDGAVDL